MIKKFNLFYYRMQTLIIIVIIIIILVLLKQDEAALGLAIGVGLGYAFTPVMVVNDPDPFQSIPTSLVEKPKSLNTELYADLDNYNFPDDPEIMIQYGGGISPNPGPWYNDIDITPAEYTSGPETMNKVPDSFGLLLNDDGCRGDNRIAYRNARMQLRSKESMINNIRKTRDTFEHIYKEELEDNDTNRDWWSRDQLYTMNRI